ncbi:competence type IV pilus minor pilin ComGD [Psychrobacillus sp. OK032]|uniref:competence type IV pilus minor pilin ComGD n=1 Tax=Psychrobacillus sp. OK032 TaxID=1884358 RepID=UPI0008C5DC29|nr:competence type IV pilus minor pilin ComGD [Psychrobacillus sp. OK032]SER80985.1 Type II secretory pathway, pseudopilin PulG [Psychrobacillus sp. OK032]
MGRVKRNEKGFTLVETILMLSIVTVLTSSIVYVTTSKIEAAEEKRFFRQFHLDMQKIQSIAIGETKYTHIYFDENGSKYVGEWANTRLFEFKVPKHMRLSIDSNLKRVSFHPNGMVTQFGTFLFEIKKGTKTVTKSVTVYIGTGRLKYEE